MASGIQMRLRPLPGSGSSYPESGGVASLNPRLMAGIPSGWPDRNPEGLEPLAGG